ncbi:MAG TPA: hypothetical protein VK277_14005 [Acidimicrobiales bacterium]|nr:hypothetical protein [Acidimicrobiales bacterium]
MKERDREFSDLYDTAWSDVKRAVDSADPEGLLESGAPSDEYDDAVRLLVRKVLKGEEITSSDLSAWFVNTYGLEANSTRVHTLVDELTSIQARLR